MYEIYTGIGIILIVTVIILVCSKEKEHLEIESPGVINIKGVTDEANAAKKEHSNEYYWCAVNKCADPGLETDPQRYRTCIDICINKNFFQLGKKLTKME